VSVTIITDTGETISRELTGAQMASMPGADNIHSASSLFGMAFGDMAQEWVLDNPTLTPMLAALKKGTHELFSRPTVQHDEVGAYVELYSNRGFKYKKFRYESASDAYDDLQYAKNKLRKDA